MQAGVDEASERWLRRYRMLWALVVLPLFLGITVSLGNLTHVSAITFLPVAAIGYALFAEPFGRWVTRKSVSAGPIVGAIAGVLAVTLIPAGPGRIMLMSALGIVALFQLRSQVTPAIVVCLVALVADIHALAYILAIAASATALTLIFFFWRRFVYAPAIQPASTTPATTPQPSAS
jgi:hypothetical protein